MGKRLSIFDKVVDTFRNCRGRRRDIREMRELDSGEFAKIARELNVPLADLDTFIHQGSHSADELPRLLTLLGIDQEQLSRTQPIELRDMTRVCSSCQQKRRCDRDLDMAASGQHYAEYCLNASAIEGLKAKTG